MAPKRLQVHGLLDLLDGMAEGAPGGFVAGVPVVGRQRGRVTFDERRRPWVLHECHDHMGALSLVEVVEVSTNIHLETLTHRNRVNSESRDLHSIAHARTRGQLRRGYEAEQVPYITRGEGAKAERQENETTQAPSGTGTA